MTTALILIGIGIALAIAAALYYRKSQKSLATAQPPVVSPVQVSPKKDDGGDKK